jgi:hypothetical protein
MSIKQRDLLATLLIALSGCSAWAFLLYNLYLGMAAPLLS